MGKFSLKFNVLFQILITIFPLITFSYITKIFSQENIGFINLVISILGYFQVVSSLSINSYAIRECSIIRRNITLLKNLVSEIYSLVVVSSIIFFIILLLIVHSFEVLETYGLIIFVQALGIVFTNVSLVWLNNVFERFNFTFMLNIFFSILSFSLMLVYVNNNNDIAIYFYITNFGIILISIINLFIYKRKIGFKFNFKLAYLKHLKLASHLIFSSFLISIYSNFDIFMISIMVGNKVVSKYIVALKIYNLVKILISSLLIVTQPKFSYLSNNSSEFSILTNKIFSLLIIIVFPMSLGLYLYSREIVLFIAGYQYLESIDTLRIFSVSIIFFSSSYYFGQNLLVSMKKEKYILKSTIFNIIINLSLNFIFIPIYYEKSAATITLIGEFIFSLYFFSKTKEALNIKNFYFDFIQIGVGLFGIIIVKIVVTMLFSSELAVLFLGIILSILVYILIEYQIKNVTVRESLKILKDQITYMVK